MSDTKVSLITNEKEIILLQGQAPKVNNPKTYELSGDIYAPKYWLGRYLKRQFNDVLVIMRGTNTIQVFFLRDQHLETSFAIQGTLSLHPILASFNINTDVKISPVELAKLVKRHRNLFDGDSFAFVKKMNDLSIKKTEDVKKAQDDRGNRAASFIRDVQSDVPQGFVLNMPIFQGSDPSKFQVDICMDVVGTEVVLWLESADLNDLLQERIDSVIAEYTELASMNGLPVIFK